MPDAMVAPNSAPELQPTIRSGRMPSAARTSAMPTAAMLRTPPLPRTRARRGRGFVLSNSCLLGKGARLGIRRGARCHDPAQSGAGLQFVAAFPCRRCAMPTMRMELLQQMPIFGAVDDDALRFL